jgi:hypothetical protein
VVVVIWMSVRTWTFERQPPPSQRPAVDLRWVQNRLPDAAGLKLSKLSGWFKEKRGLSRTEKQHVQQLILEREKAAMHEVRCLDPTHCQLPPFLSIAAPLANVPCRRDEEVAGCLTDHWRVQLVAAELDGLGIESPLPLPDASIYTTCALVKAGDVMNVDCGEHGMLSVTVPPRVNIGDSFTFTLPPTAVADGHDDEADGDAGGMELRSDGGMSTRSHSSPAPPTPGTPGTPPPATHPSAAAMELAQQAAQAHSEVTAARVQRLQQIESLAK